MKKNYWVLPEKKAETELLVGIYDDFMKIPSIESMKYMKGSKYLGEGASRAVFNYKGYVVKIAKGAFGVTQNLIERKTWSKYRNTPVAEILVPLIYTSADGTVNIQEVGTPIDSFLNGRRLYYIHRRLGFRYKEELPFYDLTEQLVYDGLWEEDVYKTASWVLDKNGWPRICDYGYDEDAQWAFKSGSNMEENTKPYYCREDYLRGCKKRTTIFDTTSDVSMTSNEGQLFNNFFNALENLLEAVVRR